MKSITRRFYLWLLCELLFSFAVLIILFLVSEGKGKSIPIIYNLLRPFTYHSRLIVYLLLIGNACLLAYFISRTMSLTKKNLFSLLVLFVWLFTVIPFGNWIKHNHFFYENWMWYSTFGLLASQFFGVLFLYIIQYQRSVLDVPWNYVSSIHSFFVSPIHPWRDIPYIMFLSSFVFVLCGVLNWYVLGGIPHVQDSIAQFFQAKIFAQGHLTLSAPSNPEFFQRIYVLVENGQWYTFYPPGFALVLSLGVLLNHPHWVNPMLSGLMIPMLFYLAARYVSIFVARLSVLFMALSPFFIMMGAGFMNHPAALFFLLLFLTFWFESFTRLRYGPWLSILAGFFYGMAFITRPMSALAFLLSGILGAGFMVQSKKKILLFFILFLVGNIPPAIFYLSFNQQTTGSPWLTGYEKYFGGNPLGFGNRPWGAEPLGPKLPNQVYHSPLRGLANTNSHLIGLNYYLFGWPIPSLTLAVFLFLPFFKKTSFDWVSLLIILSILGIYFFYFFQDYCYGPRFMYECLPFWILLSARCIQEFFQWVESHKQDLASAVRFLTYSLLVFFFFFAFGLVWVERINFMSDAYWGTDDKIAHTLRRGINQENAVIFVDDPQDYAAAFSFLNPTLDEGWIVAHNLGAKQNKELLKHYPHWPVYRLRLISTDSTNTFVTRLEKYELEKR